MGTVLEVAIQKDMNTNVLVVKGKLLKNMTIFLDSETIVFTFTVTNVRKNMSLIRAKVLEVGSL